MPSTEDKIEDLVREMMKYDWLKTPAKQYETDAQAYSHQIQQLITKARIDPFDFVEPCEPDCNPERHAYHQGQWDMAGRINKSWGLLPHPGASDE